MKITPNKLSGNIIAPSSKSISQRAIILSLLNNGKTIINNPGQNEDVLAVIHVAKSLGATIHYSNDELIIESDGKIHTIDKQINVGESGLTCRLSTAILATQEQSYIINGSKTLLNRDMSLYKEIFDQLGVNYTLNDNKLPINITGGFEVKDITIDGSHGSQYLSGMLIAYSYLIKKNGIQAPITIKVNDLKSKPYIDITIDLLQKFGFPTPKNNTYRSFTYLPNEVNNGLNNVNINIEGDWSSASAIMLAGAFHGDISIENLDMFTHQADKNILIALQNAHIHMGLTMEAIRFKKPLGVRAFHFDAEDCPDLFPALACLAAFGKGTSVIKGIDRLINKESNRLASIISLLASFGVETFIAEDNLCIIGKEAIQSHGIINTYNDHRIAMCAVILATKATNATEIDDVTSINKSYPTFLEELQKLGLQIN